MSLIGSIVGGIMTINLFKKQGRTQTREQMRLDCINVFIVFKQFKFKIVQKEIIF